MDLTNAVVVKFSFISRARAEKQGVSLAVRSKTTGRGRPLMVILHCPVNRGHTFLGEEKVVCDCLFLDRECLVQRHSFQE